MASAELALAQVLQRERCGKHAGNDAGGRGDQPGAAAPVQARADTAQRQRGPQAQGPLQIRLPAYALLDDPAGNPVRPLQPALAQPGVFGGRDLGLGGVGIDIDHRMLRTPAAAAIADTGRGTTVGSESYGKGLIQATIPLTDGSMLQMTVAKWLSIHGEWYHGHGVPAQIAAVDDPGTEEDEVLQTAINELSSR